MRKIRQLTAKVGDRQFHFQEMRHRTINEVLHTVLPTMIGGAPAVDALLAMPFMTFWKMACQLLAYVTIEDIGTINDLDTDESGYFDDHPADLYTAVAEAIKLNYPDFFKGATAPNDSAPVAPTVSAEETSTTKLA